MRIDHVDIAVIGLGYVGLPIAVEFARHFPVKGYDIRSARIAELSRGLDRTREVPPDTLNSVSISFTDRLDALRACNVYIVTVPTPIDGFNNPNLEPLLTATHSVGEVLSRGDVVIYESTVYPGATEEACVPVIEAASGLQFNVDFTVGYSPERINPGDKTHRVAEIRKITSGSTEETATFVDDLYRRIITAGTHVASSLRVAEAAKVIENVQRDVNIALVNELALIFDRLGIETQEVLDAAATKWNFIPFRPGLVGGHCIGVDPFYLTHKAQAIGYHPEIILAGRRINDSMGAHVASRVIKLMLRRGLTVKEGRVLIMGLAFKENCPDLRNSRVVDIIAELRSFGMRVDVWDPWVDAEDASREYAIEPIESPREGDYDAIVAAVAHDCFRDLGSARIRAFGRDGAVVFDVKYLFPADETDGRL